jgi:aldehyde dehydrogenase (NAD+)
MRQCMQLFIGGRWVDPVSSTPMLVENPATELAFAQISLASGEDVNRAVAAARDAAAGFAATTPQQRIGLIEQLLEVYRRRLEEVATAISEEMGAPLQLCRQMQAATMPMLHRHWPQAALWC